MWRGCRCFLDRSSSARCRAGFYSLVKESHLTFYPLGETTTRQPGSQLIVRSSGAPLSCSVHSLALYENVRADKGESDIASPSYYRILCVHFTQDLVLKMPKSILKKPLTTDKAITEPAVRSREDRNRETALYHANLLQHRKDIEALVLASTETLLDFPPFSDSDLANPSSKDASIVKNLLKPFQPSDYDALIEERNINKKCGYVLCPRRNRLQDTQAKLRILQSKGRGADALRVVERQSLEKWCSDQCGKRALYIKVQLNEEPAWARAGSVGDFVLLEDTPAAKQSQDVQSRPAEGLEKLDVGLGEEKVISAMKELAIERGDGDATSRASRLVDVAIHENTSAAIRGPSSPATSTKCHGSGGLHNAVEGYRSKFSDGRIMQRDDLDEDDDQDMIPNI